jgi:hypothetical protein
VRQGVPHVAREAVNEVVLALVRLVGDDYDVLLVAQLFEHPPKNAVSLSTPRCTTLLSVCRLWAGRDTSL